MSYTMLLHQVPSQKRANRSRPARDEHRAFGLQGTCRRRGLGGWNDPSELGDKQMAVAHGELGLTTREGFRQRASGSVRVVEVQKQDAAIGVFGLGGANQ